MLCSIRKLIRSKLTGLTAKVISQGTSPDKLALTVALGLIVGILPMFWGGTVICILLAYLFRLNQVGIQVVNYLAYPLQIALIIPFFRMGARLFPWGPAVPGFAKLPVFGNYGVRDVVTLVLATVKALFAWLIIAPPAAWLLYLCLVPACTYVLARRSQAGTNPVKVQH